MPKRVADTVGWLKPLLLLVAVILASGQRASWAYTPDSPEVKRMLAKALPYLESSNEARTGGKCLVAMALLKTGSPASHKQVQEAVVASRELAAKVRTNGIGNNTYNETIACIFLAELDPVQYRSELQILLTAIIQRQRPSGSWTYARGLNDDTSQTQYAALALWACHSAGLNVPAGTAERALAWLVRTQDPSGGFVYTPRDPGGKGLQKQGDVTQSMSAAGLGTVYVLSHLLGLGAKYDSKPEDGNGLPPAVQLVNAKKEKKPGTFTPLRSASVNRAMVQGTWKRGNDWIEKHYREDHDHHRFYYLYGLERCQSFRELVEGQEPEEAEWYNHGVDVLLRLQQDNGSWQGGAETGSIVDTAFAVLFLIRSTQKSIKKATVDEGTQRGGYGLPDDIANARISDEGKVVTPQMVKDVDDLLALIEDEANTDFDANSLPGELSLDEDLTKRTDQLQKLRNLVTDPDYKKRRIAMMGLAGARDLENVPALIYGLSDPDREVRVQARDGLRFISRKFYGFGMPPEPNKQQLQEAVKKWKDWYLSVRPDAEFLD